MPKSNGHQYITSYPIRVAALIYQCVHLSLLNTHHYKCDFPLKSPYICCGVKWPTPTRRGPRENIRNVRRGARLYRVVAPRCEPVARVGGQPAAVEGCPGGWFQGFTVYVEVGDRGTRQELHPRCYRSLGRARLRASSPQTGSLSLRTFSPVSFSQRKRKSIKNYNLLNRVAGVQ